MKNISFIFLLIFLTACANNAVHVRTNKSSVDTFSATSDDYVWHHYFLSGIFQESGVDAEKVCRNRSGVAAVVNEQRWFQSLIGALTFGIYTPRVTYIYCVDGKDVNFGVLNSASSAKKLSTPVKK